jgi:uncharacterized protein
MSKMPSHNSGCSWFSSSWNARGYDITADSLDWSDKPKVNITGYGPTGFDVLNTVKKISEYETADGTVHYNSSILVFPHGCFLWKVHTVDDITPEALAAVLLHRPKIDYLFLGVHKQHTGGGISLENMNRLREALRPIMIDQMELGNAIGTFNLLNAEDRSVAVGLLLDPVESEDE